ncbi:hypothetical protein [Pseudomonas sp. UM16]|uniref:hypothetical protein n=1 Tax=Pseudomonas sp. UM16 TaxID=3158962 RepID=UPI00398FFF32
MKNLRFFVYRIKATYPVFLKEALMMNKNTPAINLSACIALIAALTSLFPEQLLAATENSSPTVGTDKKTSEAPGAADKETSKGPSQAELEKLAKMSANPLGAAWMLWLQNDYTHKDGDNDALPSNGRWTNTTNFQPVMSFPISFGEDDWNLIVRPVIQYSSTPMDESFGDALQGRPGNIPSSDLSSHNYPFNDRTTGFGDTALMTLAGPARDDGLVWGAGITQIFPTAEHDVLGQGKYQAGPALLLVSLAPNPGGWNIGALAQHWWSYSGDSDREDTSQTDIQYFLNYRLSGTELVGMTPNIRVNWKADSGEKVNFPIGLGYSSVTKFGSLPVRWAVEFQYSVIKGDDYDADFNLRFMFIPIIQNPFASY